MKKTILIIILFVLSSPAFSNNFNKTEKIINSIIKEASENSQSDTKTKNYRATPDENKAKSLKTSINSKDRNEKKEGETLSMSEPDEVLLKSGIEFYNSGLYTFSLKQFNELNKNFPQSEFKDTSKIYTGKIYLKLFKYDNAIKAFSSVPKNSGEYAASLYYLGESQNIKGNFLSSIEKYQSVASQFPDHDLADNALLKIGKLYLRKKKGQQALETTVKLIKYYRDRNTIDDAYYLLGNIFLKDPMMKDIETARKVYKVFLKKARSGTPYFEKSPLRERVQKDLAHIEKYHFKLER